MTDGEIDVFEYFKAPKKKNKQKPRSKLLIPVTENTIFFNSRFESGNLDQVYKISDYEYSLYLTPDANNENHLTQWFYFSVKNISKGTRATFTIKNLVKDDSLFNEGMKIWVFSANKFKSKGIKWHHSCFDICYYKNGEFAKVWNKRETDYEFFKINKYSMPDDSTEVNFEKDYFGMKYSGENYGIQESEVKEDSSLPNKSMFTLTFTYEFEFEKDIVFFAHLYPYTTTDCFEYLESVDK